MIDKILSPEEEALLLGKKIAVFIAALPADDKVKQSFLDAVLLMNQEELSDLVAVLDNMYANYQTEESDKEFDAELLAIKEKFDKQRNDLEDEALAQLQILEDKLSKLL